VVWGLNFRAIDDDLTNTPLLAFFPTDVTRKWYSAFVQDEITLPGGAWRVTAGSKFERNPYTGTEIQPSVRLAWQMRPSTLLWGAISRAVRTPSRIDREIFSPATPPFVIAGGAGFGSEKLLAYELGIRSQPRPEFSYTLSTFFHDYDDLRSLEPGGAGASVLANGLVGRSYGAEFRADYGVTDNWRLQFGYTEMRVQSRAKPGSLDLTSVRSQSLDPNHQARLLSHFSWSERLGFDMALRYVAPLRNQQVPGYTELDAQLRWAPNANLEISLVGQNLLNPRHREFGSPATGRQIERSGSLTVGWTF
jgi:iron complex outermembrane receptor protein